MSLSLYMQDTGKSVKKLSDEFGIPVGTIYRWLSEEKRHGHILGIDGDNLRKLVEGSKLRLRAEELIGVRKTAA